MSEPPTEHEIYEAVSRLKVNKSGGKNGILPEMVRCCVGEMMDYIVDLFLNCVEIERNYFLVSGETHCSHCWYQNY